MTSPAVRITELDGALGVLPPTNGRLLAIVGPSSAGPIAMPVTLARTKDVVTNFGTGPLVEAGAHYIERYGRPVVLVRTEATTPGAVGTLDVSGVTGTSVVTVAAGAAPIDDFEAYVQIVKGGTLGTDQLTYQWSLDGGRTLSIVTALGIATKITLPADQAGTLEFELAAGTLAANSRWSLTTTAPTWQAADLQAALDALSNWAGNWELLQVVGPVDGDAFDVIDTKLASMAARGQYHAWIGNVRIPDAEETEAEYLADLSTEFASKASVLGALCAGACKLTSSVSGRKYRRPISIPYAAREAFVSEEVNTADVNLGTLQAVAIRDSNGNPDEHDELIFPGLDDARFVTLRTWEGLQGVYVNRPRIISAEGSDFQLVPHRRVINLAELGLRLYFIRRLNKPILVDPTTGFILEREALEIESGALGVMRSLLLAKPKASAVQFVLSRTDNVLSTKTLTGDARIVPLAYPEWIDVTIGWFNPALQVALAA